ncbi:hypothetical protein POM88_006923 [Heracleum sosnowskyi]|uniref:Uncharacterized protein n=1 Tax=Heracleum sosnowskyi TaxID=360622 RepID=A0AAD8J783_9APIA|nr:hypothetical protein POM88_006923 [Heracleum sosnowskyi]
MPAKERNYCNTLPRTGFYGTKFFRRLLLEESFYTTEVLHPSQIRWSISISHLQVIPGALKIRDKFIPAAWMLEVSSVSAEHQFGMDLLSTTNHTKHSLSNRAHTSS